MKIYIKKNFLLTTTFILCFSFLSATFAMKDDSEESSEDSIEQIRVTHRPSQKELKEQFKKNFNKLESKKGNRPVQQNNGIEEFTEEDEINYQQLLQRRKNTNQRNKKNSFAKSVENTAKKTTGWFEIFESVAYVGSGILRIVGCDKEATGLEKIALACKFTSGTSRVVSGVANLSETGDVLKNSLNIGIGFLKVGNSCFQYGALKRHEEFKLKQEDIKNKLCENNLKKEELLENKKQMKFLFDNKDTSYDHEEDKKLEKAWKEHEDLESINKQQYLELMKEQQNCDLQMIGFDCAEGICISSMEDFENGSDLKSALIKNTREVFKKVGCQIFSKTMKDENKKNEIMKFFSNLLSEVKQNFVDSAIKNISDFKFDKNDDRKFLEGL